MIRARGLPQLACAAGGVSRKGLFQRMRAKRSKKHSRCSTCGTNAKKTGRTHAGGHGAYEQRPCGMCTDSLSLSVSDSQWTGRATATASGSGSATQCSAAAHTHAQKKKKQNKTNKQTNKQTKHTHGTRNPANDEPLTGGSYIIRRNTGRNTLTLMRCNRPQSTAPGHFAHMVSAVHTSTL